VTFFDLELRSFRVYEAELSARMFAPERGVAFIVDGPSVQRSITATWVHNRPAQFGVRVERLDHEPLISISGTHFGLAHARP
jgi:hypothetical protein